MDAITITLPENIANIFSSATTAITTMGSYIIVIAAVGMCFRWLKGMLF